MAERPILFSGPMVRAILDGKKTQTRRLVTNGCLLSDGSIATRDDKNYAYAGDTLWVRETWATGKALDDKSPKQMAAACLAAGYRPWAPLWYTAGGSPVDGWAAEDFGGRGRTRASIHMPRWASRISLRVESVRVERLNDLSGGDAVAEGIDAKPHLCACETCAHTSTICTASTSSLIMEFSSLWDQINGKRAPWASNPWVWVVEFTTLKA